MISVLLQFSNSEQARKSLRLSLHIPLRDDVKRTHLPLNIEPQPDDSTCGPTCLHAVYRYYGDDLELPQLIGEVPVLEEGGTLAVQLGGHALKRGYRASIYTYNLTVFDPTWFVDTPKGKSTKEQKGQRSEWLIQKLQAQIAAKNLPKLQAASAAYIEFLRLGGELRMQDLNAPLLRRYLRKGIPILTGLSATYLYRSCRELADTTDDDVAVLRPGTSLCCPGTTNRRKQFVSPIPIFPTRLAHTMTTKSRSID